MEEIIQQLVASGQPLGIIAAVIVYLVIFFQRKQTSEKRNDDTAALKEEIAKLKSELADVETDKQLMQKDLDHLIVENIGIKEDIKEIKTTLNSMALALERIAAKYDDNNK